MKEYNYYLFDLDGTLISTIDMILECFRHSLQYAGNIKIDPEEIKSHVGLPLQKQFEIYLKDKPGIDYQKLKEYHMNYQLKIWQDHVYLYPGIRQTLEKLQQLNKTMAVVTSRKIKTTTIYTEKLGIRSFFKLLVTPENTEKHKPNPEPVLYTLSRLKADPGQSVFIGDSNFDIKCGTGAGIDTAFAAWGASGKAPEQATCILNKSTDILPD